MAEPRRLEFTTITPAQKPKKKLSYTPSERFSLKLVDSTDSTCPEFSYAELVKTAVRKKKERQSSADPSDPFGDGEEEDEKLEAIAKAFEEKYGPKVKTKKGRPSDRLRDLVDLGEGYDETDAFIDNSEAYDEMVPRCLTTKLGGFYINSGLLDFRYASEDSGDDFQISSLKKKRKIRTIESDSDSNSEVKKRGPKKRKLKEGLGLDGEKKKKKRLMVGPDGEKIIVKRGRKPLDKDKLKKNTSPTVSELLKQQTAATSTPTHAVNGAAGGGGDASHIDEGYNPYEQIGSTIEMLLKEDSESREVGDDDKKPESVTPLPSGLPALLVQTIARIIQAAKDSREGKCKFFSGNVNKMLLDIENQSRQLACGARSTIYAHLTCFLPCGKETLLKRAKKLRLTQQEDVLREPIEKLKEAVNKMMPTLQEKYDAEMQLVALMRLENREKGESEGKEDGSTESDDEEKTGQDGEKKKRIMGPRKKFEWTDHVRNLLCDVVRAKMKMFNAHKVKGQTGEEFVRCFLDTQIRPIWPQGWMQTRMLYKESRAAHSQWTSVPKIKKLLPGSIKSGSPTPTSAQNNNGSIVEIFDAENDTGKEGSESDRETSALRLEDYMDINDVDNMLKELGKSDCDTGMPTLLDYADKMNTSSSGATPDVKHASGSEKIQQPKSHSSSSSVMKKDSVKHGLVSEMLQNPLPPSNKSAASGMLSPKSETKSAYMAEFEKHIKASFKESPPVPQGSPPEQSASSKLQSMLSQAQQANSGHARQSFATPKSLLNTSGLHEQPSWDMQKQAATSSQKHSPITHQAAPRIQGQAQGLHSQHSSSLQQHKGTVNQGQKSAGSPHQKSVLSQHKQYSSESRPSSGQKDLVMPASLSQAAIDEEAMRKIQQQLQHFATASVKYGSGSAQHKSPVSDIKSSSASKFSSKDTVLGQMFKQPLPATMANQQRQAHLAKPSVTSALQIDTQNSVGVSVPRHSPHDQLRISPQGHKMPQVQIQKQTGHSASASLLSPNSSRKPTSEMSGKSVGSPLSPTHARSLLGRQSPSGSYGQDKRNPTSKDSVPRQKMIQNTIMDKIMDDYKKELHAKNHPQHQHLQHKHSSSSNQQRVSPQSPSQGSLPRSSWQQQLAGSSPVSSGQSHMSAFSPPAGSQRPAASVPQMNLAGYQGAKMSSMSRESALPQYSPAVANLQQRSRPQDLMSGIRVSAPPPAHSAAALSPTPGVNTYSSHSSHSPSPHSTLSSNQRPLPGLPPLDGNPHMYMPQHISPPAVNTLYGRTIPDSSQSQNRY